MPGCVFSGVVIYIILSHLLVSDRIVIPLSVTISILVFGLARYFYLYNTNKIIGISTSLRNNKEAQKVREKNKTNYDISNIKTLSRLSFMSVFIVMLITVSIFPTPVEERLFLPWDQFQGSSIIQMVSAIGLCFFLPGYALVVILEGVIEKRLSLQILLSYIFSILITGLASYVGAYAELEGWNLKILLVCIYAAIVTLFILKIILENHSVYKRKLLPYVGTLKLNQREVSALLTRDASKLLVYASLISVMIISTYYLYNGGIIGDQWDHHGRSLNFISGEFKDLAVNGVDEIGSPPFFPALLASFFVLSGVPSVNAYVSINFLNIIPVLAFYYFFTKWVPPNMKRAALLASALFMLSSGFGWAYVLGLSSDQPIISQASALGILHDGGIKTFDIRLPATFIGVSNPDITTGLPIIALPTGLALLGIIKESRNTNNCDNKSNNFSSLIRGLILAGISILGLLAHDEFYFFIIIGCIAPLVFTLRRKGSSHFIFAAFLGAILIVLLFDTIFPGKYYTTREILGMPLIAIVLSFVSVLWAVYFSGILQKVRIKIHVDNTLKRQGREQEEEQQLLFHQQKIKKKRPNLTKTSPLAGLRRISSNRSFKFTLGIAVVSTVTYFYIFSFIVWDELSQREVQIQTLNDGQREIPWYLYPMKLGVAGLLGLAFVLSYLFKKFEKEVFIFGLIAIIALVTGPYYDEHRFSKYMMLGMVGFASLFVYRIIQYIATRLRINNMLPAMVLGIIITFSALSTFMFWGYNDLALGAPGHVAFNMVCSTCDRRFPSSSELEMLSFLDNNHKGLESYNIAASSTEYEPDRGLGAKLEGFSSLPPRKLLQSPLTLNSSTLEGFYNLLNFSDARYVVLSTKDIDESMKKRTLVDPIVFALKNFKTAYQNDKYLVLSVPRLLPPMSTNDSAGVGFLYDADQIRRFPLPLNAGKSDVLQHDPKGSSTSYSNSSISSMDLKQVKVMEYNSNLFELEETKHSDGAQLWKIEDANSTSTLNSGDLMREVTLFSKPVKNEAEEYSKLNYLEGKFRVLGENKSLEEADNNHAGIVWDDGKKIWYAFLRNSKLSIYNSIDKEFSANAEIVRENGIWYTLQILFLKNSTDIYLDGLPQLKIPTNSSDNYEIFKLGIRSDSINAEFGPIKIGNVVEIPKELYQKEIYYQHYYPLTSLALSDLQYDTFIQGDMSALSKRYIILPYDPLYENEDDIRKYLEYVKSGGNLIVLNSDIDFKGLFSKLFSAKVGNKSNFDSVLSHNKASFNQLFNVSGTVRSIDFKSPDITILSSYMDKNQTIAPFAVEKNLGKGRIVLVNSYGFFESVFDSPDKYFSSLNNIYELIDLRLDDNKNLSMNVQPDPAAPAMRFIGNLTMSGQATIRGSSLLLEDNTFPSRNFYVEKIYVSSKANDASKYDMKSIGWDMNNMLVKDLKLSGRYDAIINFTGDFHLPYFPSSSSLSYYDYIPIFVPTGFDLVIKLSDTSSTAEFAIGNSSKPILITDNQIIFHNVRPEVHFTKPVPALVKNPEVTLSGKVAFGELVTVPRLRGDRLIVEGNTSMQLDHADLYHDRYNNKESEEQLSSVTYLRWVDFDDDAVTRASNEIKIPGDVSDLSKQQGVRVPWFEALVSPTSLISLACIVTLSALAIRYLQPKIRKGIS